MVRKGVLAQLVCAAGIAIAWASASHVPAEAQAPVAGDSWLVKSVPRLPVTMHVRVPPGFSKEGGQTRAQPACDDVARLLFGTADTSAVARHLAGLRHDIMDRLERVAGPRFGRLTRYSGDYFLRVDVISLHLACTQIGDSTCCWMTAKVGIDCGRQEDVEPGRRATFFNAVHDTFAVQVAAKPGTGADVIRSLGRRVAGASANASANALDPRE